MDAHPNMAPVIYWHSPQPLGLGRSEIATIAATVALRIGYWPGESLHHALHALGGRLDPAPADDAPALEVRPSGFVIAAAPDASRTAVARNLGHYVLHVLYTRQHRRLDIQHLRVSRDPANPVHPIAVREATDFAFALLMPAAKFAEVWSKQRANTIAIAKHFGVDPRDVRDRAMQLDLAPNALSA